jgi:hypothetical protein
MNKLHDFKYMKQLTRTEIFRNKFKELINSKIPLTIFILNDPQEDQEEIILLSPNEAMKLMDKKKGFILTKNFKDNFSPCDLCQCDPCDCDWGN